MSRAHVLLRMEVDFVLCLFMLGLTVCVGLHPIHVTCIGCACKSPNGAELLLDKLFDTPQRRTSNKSSYYFPSCLESNPCDNSSSGLICVTKDAVHSCINSSNICILPDITNHSQKLALKDRCNITISCSYSPVQDLDDDMMVFNVSDCGRLKAFVSSATSIPPPPTPVLLVDNNSSSNGSLSSTTTNYSLSSTDHSMPSTAMAMNSSSSSNTANCITTNTVLTSHMASTSKITSVSITMKSLLSTNKTPSKSTTASPTPHTQAPSSSNASSKLLYIVIPTAAPVAFIISFITVFSLLNWCHQRSKKKLYIKLTSTIYSEEDDSDDDLDD